MAAAESKEVAEFQFPSCWNDDNRMSGFCAVPRSEALNPYDWPGKFKFWNELILEWASFHKKLTVDYEELKQAFTIKTYRYPLSLERVLTEMNKQGIIHLQDQYLYQKTQSSWTSWSIGLVKTSVSWSWKKVMSALVEIESEVPRYVIPSVLKERSENVLQLPVAMCGETLEIDELVEMHPEFFSNSKEAHILLTHLHNTGKITIDTSSPQTVIKFNVPEKIKSSLDSSFRTTSSSLSPVQSKSKEKPSEITEVDRSLAKLKRTEKLLQDEIDKLEIDMNSLQQTAKSRLKAGSRSAAKSALCHRKKLQSTVDKHHIALMNIQTLKIQLCQSKTDSKVLEAYQIGLSALKASLSDMPLNEEQIQDTMLELEDTLEQQRDIESMLSATITTDDVAESDLEDELMSILDEEKKQKEEEELEFPAVPTDSPTREGVSEKKAFQKEQQMAR